MSLFRPLALAVIFGAAACANAFAADMPFPQAEPIAGPQEKLTFGTGWYLRGDIAWSREKRPVLFNDPALGATSKLDNKWSATAGFGYKFNNWFRTDLTVDAFKEMNPRLQSGAFNCVAAINGVIVGGVNTGITPVNGQCDARQSGKMPRYAVLANGYIDLGTWSGVTPYIGAGAGVVYGRVRGNYNWFTAGTNNPYAANLVAPAGFPVNWVDAGGNPIAAPITAFGVQNQARTYRRNGFNFAWALMAGTSYDISPNAKIDLGYRFLNLGKFGLTSKTVTASEYRIGVRYMID